MRRRMVAAADTAGSEQRKSAGRACVSALLADVLGFAAYSLVAAAPAQAATRHPYCARFHEAIVYEDCSFDTLQQCRDTASGRAAECYRDPFYAGPSPEAERGPRAHKPARTRD